MTDTATNMYMPVAPAYGMGGNGGFGFGGDNAWWIIILLIFMGGWGNNSGWGNNGGMNQIPYWMMQQNNGNDVQRGFDQTAIMSGINGINSAVTTGFGNVQTALCNGFAGVNSSVSNGFAQAEIANNARQMADMNQNFAMQSALSGQLNSLSMGLQNCCCENRAATADLKYTVANEACADRAAVTNALRDVTAQGVANTQALMNTMNAGIQSIKDQMCNDKIDAKNERIAELERQLTMSNLAASQGQQTAQILANLAPNPVPAYLVQNPNGCGQFGYNCGCGCGAA